MVPVPQYPLYTATISLLNGQCVPYYLNEEKEWSCEIPELERSIKQARSNNVNVRAIVIINPGNPTGGVLSEKSMQDIIRFAYENRLVILADEVYQGNIHADGVAWQSFRKALHEMPMAHCQRSKVQIASFHSISKGVLGECGRRGGYVEFHNIPDDVLGEFYKLASISLCTNVQGQIAVDILVNPPSKADQSYDLYNAETKDIANSLRSRALKLCSAFNELPGISCNKAAGAMYLFARLMLPKAAEQAATQAGVPLDTFYTLALLNATGICVVPGSGFLQKPGTFHFRTTFLPAEDKIDAFITSFKHFHHMFLNTYRDS